MGGKLNHKTLYLIIFNVLLVLVIAIIFLNGGSDEVEPVELIDDFVSFSFVSGTEYSLFDPGQVIVELRDRQYNPINATCYLSILYPNKTYFVNNNLMTQNTPVGTQYYNFTVPAVVGVYEYSANCTRNNKNYIAGKSFHVTKGRLNAWIER